MAPRHSHDDGGKLGLRDGASGSGRLLKRRGYLRLAGLAVGSALAVGAGTGGATAQEDRVVTVPAGGSESFSVGSGETLENLLIDVTADGADAHVAASGDGWTVRNVGVRGSFDTGRESGGSSNFLAVDGTGTVENVYLGDGHADNVRKGAIGCGPGHAGHIDVVNTYVAHWSGNAVYAAGMGRVNPPGKTDGAGGTLRFSGCYFRDNNIAHLRLASDGSTVEDCVFHNTNQVPAHPNTSGGASDVVNSRGIYTGYGDPSQTITVSNCHFDVTGENTNGDASAIVSDVHSNYGPCTTVRVVDSEVRGELVGEQVVTENVGSNPDVTRPAGVPADAEAAAGGAAAGAETADPTGGEGNATAGTNATASEDDPDDDGPVVPIERTD